jgi:hypothetical protein
MTPHFSYEEAVRSETAARLGIDNTPPADIRETIRWVAHQMEDVRTFLGHPITVTSWYRCPKLNEAVRSKPTSQHIKGEAVDFVCPAFGTPRAIVAALRRSAIPFDQLILEYADTSGGGWTHISFTDDPRGQVLAIGCKF